MASTYWAYTVYVKDNYSLHFTIINFILDVIIGISLTHSYRWISRKTGRRVLSKENIFYIVLAIIVLAFAFMLLVNVKWYLYWKVIQDQDLNFVTALLFWDPPLIAGLRLMAIWVLLYHLYHYHVQQLSLTTHNAKLAILSKQVQIDNLTNQLNPHFLFNSLNSVKSLISESPSKAKRSIDLLSDILRSFLYSKGNLTMVRDELELVTDYVELEKLRFEERLHLKVTVKQEAVYYQKIPPLCIQTLVENALKHGIQNSIKGGEITITLDISAELLKIEVRNPGKLAPKEAPLGPGLGLKNLNKRLQLQYQGRASFDLRELTHEIVCATLLIPLN